jgi:gas vesicle protein
MGRFLLGFAFGAALGAAAVIFTTSRSGPALREGIGDTFKGAIDAAKHASAAREQALWSDFRTRLDYKAEP